VSDITSTEEEKLAELAWERAAEDADLTLELPGGIPMFFRLIPATGPEGFRMGARGYGADEEPVHRVVIPQPFYLGTFPVTQEQFAVWTPTPEYDEWFRENSDLIRRTSWNKKEKAEPHSNGFPENPKRPAEQVTFWEAVAFGELLKKMDTSGNFPAKHVGGVPTEAQWEYACRKSTDTEYWSGDGEAALAEVAWYDGNSKNRTHITGGKNRENPFGLHDMHGNVWEWCRDEWEAQAYSKKVDGVTDPFTEPKDDEAGRVLRGGSWGSSARICRAPYRDGDGAGIRLGDFGFRVCLFPGSGGQAQSSHGEAPGGGSAGTERKPEGGGGAGNPLDNGSF
jgi:formylglycine-generating enzyme required for sulfatase activity